MSWLDDRIKEDSALRERLKMVSDEAPNVFLSLWKEVVKVIDEAKEKQFAISTNGSGTERVVRANVLEPPPRTSRNQESIYITLADDELSISVSGKVEVKFVLDVCPDNVVCLKENGKIMPEWNAAKRIIDEFLFPHLYKLHSNI